MESIDRQINGFLHRPHELVIAELLGFQWVILEATLCFNMNHRTLKGSINI